MPYWLSSWRELQVFQVIETSSLDYRDLKNIFTSHFVPELHLLQFGKYSLMENKIRGLLNLTSLVFCWVPKRWHLRGAFGEGTVE